MWRRLLACWLLVTAGCNVPTDGGVDESTPTVTPVPVPAAQSSAPGVVDGSVVSPRALADAHVDALANTSYRLTVTRTVRDTNGTVRQRLHLDLVLAADRSYRVDTATAGPDAPVFLGTPPAAATFWSNGSVYARELTRDGRTTYNTFRAVEGAGQWQYWARTVPFGGEQATPRRFLVRTFRAIDVSVVGRTTSNGTVVYRLRGDDAVGPLDEEVSSPQNVSLTATVTERGLVIELSLQYTGTVDGERVHVRRTVRYRDVGETTVRSPSWLDRAVG